MEFKPKSKNQPFFRSIFEYEPFIQMLIVNIEFTNFWKKLIKIATFLNVSPQKFNYLFF